MKQYMDVTADRVSIECEPYTKFTEDTEIVKWNISLYRDEILNLATPLSAGWPEVLTPILTESSTVVGFDLNQRQIQWYKSRYPDCTSPCFLSDISNPSEDLQMALDSCNFLFVSNIPDWLAGVTSWADTADDKTHQSRRQRFVDQSCSFLCNSLNITRPTFILISSTSDKFIDDISTQIQEAVQETTSLLEANVRNPSIPKNYRSKRTYPIDNYRVIECYPK